VRQHQIEGQLPIATMPDGEAVEPGEPLEHSEASQQQHLNQQQIGAE